MDRRRVLTIGHSNHTSERLLALLAAHDVTAIADVRSTPYSRFNPSFNREPLAQALKDCGIAYAFLGRELGARSKDPSCYENGKVKYRRLVQTELFRAGLEPVIEGASTHQLALLCAEKEPLACHRTLLVARELEGLGVPVSHIHADGQLESHDEAMTRLLGMLGLPEHDLLHSRAEQIADAYSRQEARVAFVRPVATKPDSWS